MSSQKELIVATIKELKKEEAKNNKNKAYHNVKMLMKNYNILKKHSENAVYKLDTECKELFFQDVAEETYIKSILSSKIRTSIMVQHIDMALEVLKEDCIKKDNLQQYQVFYDFYVLELKIEDMVTKYCCVESTIHRRKNEMLRRLGVILFGVEGLL